MEKKAIHSCDLYLRVSPSPVNDASVTSPGDVVAECVEVECVSFHCGFAMGAWDMTPCPFFEADSEPRRCKNFDGSSWDECACKAARKDSLIRARKLAERELEKIFQDNVTKGDALL